MPGFIEPCDPTLHETAPTRSGWVYEIKTDGYRAQVHIRAKRVTVYSRSGYDWTDEFAPIAKAALFWATPACRTFRRCVANCEIGNQSD
jgi:bifunctional non-homologous end joining protein LigD